MAERDELIRRNGPSKSYGSVSKLSDDENEFQRPVRCLCTRRDCILVSVLSIMIAVAITTSLAIGIPAIEQKQNHPSPYRGDLSTPQNTGNPSITITTTTAASTTFGNNETESLTNISYQSTAYNSNVTATLSVAKNQTSRIPAVLVYKRAAVAADDPRCADIGSSILKLNGSAVDAAISTLLCLEAVNPQHSGIGGGFFMVIYSKSHNKSYVLDARETAPANATVDMFNGNESLALTGGLSIAIPGTLQGYLEAHTRFGRLPWKELFAPTIQLCRSGFKIYSGLASALKSERDYILKEPSLREVYINNATGDIYKENDTLHRPGFADTLEKLASQGARFFYEGKMATQLIDEIQKAGGIISLADLRNYTVRIKEALEVTIFDNFRLHTVPPPSSGALLAFILNTLEDDILTSSPNNNLTNVNLVTLTQRFIETLKFAYAFRSQLGDEDFVNMTELIQKITSKNVANSIRKRIYDNTTFDPSYYFDNLRSVTADQGTSHLQIFSQDGDVVSVTSTINQRFGSKLRSRALDIFLNDEMGDFLIPKDSNVNASSISANLIAPGKRPLSTMTPSIFFNSKREPILGIGGAGGIAILSSVAEVLFKHKVLKLSLNESISSPRIHHQLIPNILYMEPTFPKSFVESFRNIGHEVSLEPPLSHVNAILRMSNGSLVAVSDLRMSSGTSGF